jgi:trimeric autotransporter adhesin
VNARDVLSHVATLPLEMWNFRAQDPSIRHIGPMAQDFYAAFGVGEDEKHISTVDADGVALAAIQGLYQELKDRDAKIATLEARLTELEQVMKQLAATEKR